MEDSEGIQEIVNRATIQTATVVMMVFRDTDAGPRLAITESPREPQAEAWWTGSIKAIIQLECLEQV